MEAGSERSRIAIVGGGFSGIAMAIRLKQRGINDFVVLERASEVGGVWQQNTYPGCMCDVPSHLYSLSFAPNPEWSHTYSAQSEIREYLGSTAERFGIRPHIRTGVELKEASWNSDEHVWEIETSEGRLVARVLVSAMGPLNEPNFPDVPGLEKFKGKTMHSARWDHDYELKGKRVASIGTGASAIQFVPAIQPEVESLHVFQRTPPWVMPHNDRPISDRERTIFRRFPIAQRLIRGGIYSGRELMVLAFAKEPRLMRLLEKAGRTHIAKAISDPDLRARVTPDYTLGCKRIVPSNRWYPALAKDNVELVGSPLSEIRENSVIDGDGIEREVDAIIFGTGFHVTDTPYAELIRGRDGIRISDRWRGSPRAYLGTAVPDFPNLFLLLGPNTGLGHSSMVYMIESQVEHVLEAIAAMDRGGASAIEVRPDTQADFNRAIDEKMSGTVWETGGCSSFYHDTTGRNATLWPDFTWRFRRRASKAGPREYSLARSERETVSA